MGWEVCGRGKNGGIYVTHLACLDGTVDIHA